MPGTGAQNFEFQLHNPVCNPANKKNHVNSLANKGV